MLVVPKKTNNDAQTTFNMTDGDNTFIAGGRVIKDFPELMQGKSIHFVWNGDYALHDLIIHLLKKTGPAYLHIASFSVSEDAARILLNALNAGYILSGFFFFDHRTKVNNAKAVNMIQERFTVRYGKVHAKTALLKNDFWNLSVFGSSNLTANPRTERGAIFTDINVYNFDLSWILGK